MSILDPEPGEPGYTIKKLREAETDQEFIEAYLAHKKTLEGHKIVVRPYDAICARVIERYGQYRMGDSGNDERREDALWLLKEFQRYFALSGFDVGGINGASAVKKRTLAEIEADIAHVAMSVQGCERSNLAFGEAFPADRATPTSRQLVAAVDLGCTEMDDHDPPPCPKCDGIREQVAKVIDATLAESTKLEDQSRCAGLVLFGPGTTKEDLEQMAKDGIKRGAAAELELRRRQAEREEAAGSIQEEG